MSHIGMNETNEYDNNNSSEFSGFMMVVLLFKHKWYIIMTTIIAAIVSIIYSLSLPNWYSASINVVPPKSAGNILEQAMGGLSSALKEVGLSKLTGGKTGDQYSFSVILNSRTIADSIIKKYKIKESYIEPQDIAEVKESDVRKMFIANLDVSNETDGNYVITILDKDSSRVDRMVTDYVYYANELAKSIYHSETNFNRKYLETRMQSLDTTLNNLSAEIAIYSKETGLIAPEEQAKSYISAVSDLKVELYKQEMILERLKQKFGEGDQMTIAQKNAITTLKSKLNQAENTPGLVGNFTKNDAAAKGIKYLSKYAQFEALSKLKLILMPMYEEALINEKREIITLSVVDPAVKPDKKSKPKRSLIVAGATLGGTFGSILIILAIYGIRVFSAKYKIALAKLK